MTIFDADCVVIGGGVIGVAVARALARNGRETLVLERHGRPGEETSSRNSGVVHSGIYYPLNSLKARFCVRGRELLYAFCREFDVAHRKPGKLIVAQADQMDALRALHRRAIANGVDDLRWLGADEVSALEPEVRCEAALLSPSTGIVDVPEFITALIAGLEAAGGTVSYRSSAVTARPFDGGFEVDIRSGDEDVTLRTRCIVNSAGLHALDMARRIGGGDAARLPVARFAKGNYFSCSGRAPFTHLVYPMPNSAGLGVHATLGLDSSVRFGPDVEWVDSLDYDVAPARAGSFYAAIREYWPGLRDGALQPAYAGIRPKLVGPGDAATDFVIEDETVHGVPGLVNLLGIESPGLTSSLAIAEHVAAVLPGRS
jgi:L-2-hydroxyglutarate oxidase LhgO